MHQLVYSVVEEKALPVSCVVLLKLHAVQCMGYMYDNMPCTRDHNIIAKHRYRKKNSGQYSCPVNLCSGSPQYGNSGKAFPGST